MRLAAPSQIFWFRFCIVSGDVSLAAQAVAALEFTDQGRVLVSGGGDAIVHAWLLAEVLDIEALPTAGCNSPSPSRFSPRTSALLLALAGGCPPWEIEANGGRTGAATDGERDAFLQPRNNHAEMCLDAQAHSVTAGVEGRCLSPRHVPVYI